MKLKEELPMTPAMYVKLINHVAKTTLACAGCRHNNGECIIYAKHGTCNAMHKSINEILVFHTGNIEFATTRRAVAHALEVNQENDENPWIGETVYAVIEDYLQEIKEVQHGSASVFAMDVYNLLSDCDILAIINWEEE